MDGNKRRLRNMLLYAGIPVVVLFIIFFLFRASRKPTSIPTFWISLRGGRWRSTS